MAPALIHGLSLGPYDQLTRLGLAQPTALAYKLQAHNPQVADLIREIIPWTSLSWTQVHQGVLPLWNPYSALGAPLAFNWQSATFSLPALLGYLVPVRLDFTVQVLVNLVIGGTGVYVLGRVMRFGVLGAAMAATAFELSGAFMAVLGWPIAAVMSWSGWLFACVVLIVRGRHRRRHVILFAVVFALSIYAGEPDTLLVLVAGLAVFAVVAIGLRVRRHRDGPGWHSVVDLALGFAAGLGLAAPLVLPAAQLTGGSIRGSGHLAAFPAYQALHLVFQTFDGSPLTPLATFNNHGLTYVPPAAYIGVIPVVLAVMAVVKSRRRPVIVALAVTAVVTAGMVYLSPLVSLLNDLPGLGEIRWVRAIQVLAFASAVLSGAGLDFVVRSKGDGSVRRWLGAAFGLCAVLLLLLWLFGRGQLPPFEAHIRAGSFIWPTVEVAIGLAVFGFLVLARPRNGSARRSWPRLLGDPGRVAGVVLLVSSTSYLVVLGAPWWTSNTSYLAPTSGEVALQRAVGSSIVGFGTSSCWYAPTLGIQPEVNIVYGVHELGSYDPLTPQNLYTAWADSTHSNPRPVGPYYTGLPISLFCPVIRTVADARLFGVGFVLEPHGVKGPAGTVFDKAVGNEELYRVPGASVATLSSLGADGALPPVTAAGTPVTVTYPTPTSWKLTTHATTPQVLRLRLTDVPGWHASIDGKPLALTRYNRIMLQARIPAGTHTIELHYWPDAFTAGIAVGAATVIALVLVVVIGRRRHRHPPQSSAGRPVG